MADQRFHLFFRLVGEHRDHGRPLAFAEEIADDRFVFGLGIEGRHRDDREGCPRFGD